MNQTDHELLKALANASYTHTPHAVWDDSLVHVPAVNTNIAAAVRSCVEAVKPEGSENPVGLPIVGTKGSGKTHELANARQEVQTAGGIFIHVDSVKADDFWETVRDKLLDSLDEGHTRAETQAQYLLGTLAYELGLEQPYSTHLMNGTDIRPEHIVQLTKALEKNGHRQVKLLRVASALAVMRSEDYEQRAIGFDFLAGNAESQSGDRKRFRLPKTSLSPQDTVRFFSRLVAIVAPTVVGVDQLDVELEDMESSTDGSRLGHSLVELRDTMTRTVTIVACQPRVWRRMAEDEANSSVKDRFLPKVSFDELLSPDVARELVAAHFRPHFENHGYDPPYPTWPVAPEALEDAPQFRPRELLKVITDHLRKCIQDEKVVELKSLLASSDAPATPAPRAAEDDHQRLDALFNDYHRKAEVGDAFDPTTEDETVPTILTTGLGFAIREQESDNSDWQVVRSNKPASGWHAQVVRDLGNHVENPVMWTIGFLSHTHWKAMRSRTRKLRLHSQVSPGDERRHAILVRPKPWRNTKTAKDTENEFRRATGQIITEDLSDDLKVFQALQRLESEGHDGFEQWLRERHHASATRIARAVFGEPPGAATNDLPIDPDSTEDDATPSVEATPSDEATPPVEARPPLPPAAARDDPDRLDFGIGEGRGEPVGVDLKALRKHVAIFAGSGSGKTVLIRRLVEECALRGVSAIVLDPNNDLARLGEPWTDPPATWLPGDDLLSERYLKETEVVIWTPRREAGRPLSFQPLPDFASVIDDPDEYNQALDTAVSTLAPRARVDKNTAKAEQGRAVLREALRHFSKRPAAADLAAFIDLLADLPDDITNIDKASSMAHEMAQTLAAAAINDPLFGGSGTPLDPGVLLTPSAGKRARISVISFIGLADAVQRQSFVNQLQMALFAWIKRHPSADKPLSGLMVMDEAQTFAPSGAMTTCTESTLALASQARKYGLGLVFATQAPRGIHNRIVGNASTQFFGFLNSPPQIDAAREMARSKSSSVPDISRLSAGQFYAVSEGLRFQKVSVPMCLSHHPSSALTTEEVLALACR